MNKQVTRNLSKKTRISLDIGENYKDPSEFRDCVVLADKLGFDTAWLGDHFMPWYHSGNKSSFVWSLIASCLERTERIKVGPLVTTPIGGRYHPALVAQACATLDNLYPGRMPLGVGSGEAMNEVPFFGRWPAWEERIERTLEGIKLMRLMWESEDYFDFHGKFFPMNNMFLYTKPKSRIRIYFSAIGPKAAKMAGESGEDLLTLNSHNSFEKCRYVVIPSFESGAELSGRLTAREKVISLSFHVGKKQDALKEARESAGIIAKGSLNEPDPRKIQKMGNDISDEKLLERVTLCSNWDEALDFVKKFDSLGLDEIVLPSGPNPDMILKISQEILPHFR
jgi:G6PDH family F420-dependent oxidoreductase